MKIRNPNLQKIIDSHINEWFIKEKTKLERKKKERKPLILISRQRGAGGLSVAERLEAPYPHLEATRGRGAVGSRATLGAARVALL
ncbi:MAG: hypothetical protein P8Y09_08680 [Deltaproteobacteria bacterium]